MDLVMSWVEDNPEVISVTVEVDHKETENGSVDLHFRSSSRIRINTFMFQHITNRTTIPASNLPVCQGDVTTNGNAAHTTTESETTPSTLAKASLLCFEFFGQCAYRKTSSFL
jgi:hypothetical protein